MKIFLAASIEKNFEDIVKQAMDGKFNLEISEFADPVILDNNYKSLVKEYKNVLKGYNGQITLHGSFLDLNPASKDSKIVEITKERFSKNLEVATELGATTIVFHSGYNGMVKNATYKYKFIENKIKFWKEYIKKFEDAGVIAALENTYEEKPEILLEIIQEVNSPNLKYCIDTGHVNINSKVSLNKWIETTKEYIHHLHLHNNHADFDDHLSMKNGTLDFESMLETLNSLNLNPNLVVEVFDYNQAMESFEYLKEIKEKVLV